MIWGIGGAWRHPLEAATAIVHFFWISYRDRMNNKPFYNFLKEPYFVTAGRLSYQTSVCDLRENVQPSKRNPSHSRAAPKKTVMSPGCSNYVEYWPDA